MEVDFDTDDPYTWGLKLFYAPFASDWDAHVAEAGLSKEPLPDWTVEPEEGFEECSAETVFDVDKLLGDGGAMYLVRGRGKVAQELLEKIEGRTLLGGVLQKSYILRDEGKIHYLVRQYVRKQKQEAT